MNHSEVLAGTFIVIIAVMAAICGYGLSQIFGDIAGGDPFFQENDYSVTGSYNGIDASGTGRCTYSVENDDLLVYDFYFDMSDKDGVSHKGHSVLLCNGKGVPTADFSFEGTDTDGFNIWTLTENGVDYEYHIGDRCRVHTLSIDSGSLSMVGTIVS